MASDTGLIRLALFGAPVRHSLSPQIHAAFARQGNLKVSYRAIETPPGALADALQKFAASGGAGCNITLPLKREAMELAADCSDRVQRAEAANTLVRLDGGSWRAENTDGTGLVRDLRADGRFSLPGARIALLGAGGAAAGILAAVLEAGPAEVRIFNRTPGRAARLAARHADLGAVAGTGLDAVGGAGFDLVINATSAGHHGDLPPMPGGLFGPGGGCCDLNYGPAAEPLRQWCLDQDIPYRDGLGMLVEQAAESFALWTNFKPDTGAVLAQLRRP